MDSLDILNNLLDELTGIDVALEDLELKTKPLKSRKAAIREELTVGMKASDLKTLKNSRMTLSMGQKRSITITDESEVEGWLLANNFKLDDYLTLRKEMVDQLALAALESTGEVIDGTKVELTDYISIRKANGNKKESE